MENPPALEVNDNGLQIQIYILFRAASLQMAFSDGKLVYADTVHSLKAEHSDTQDDACESL